MTHNDDESDPETEPPLVVPASASVADPPPKRARYAPSLRFTRLHLAAPSPPSHRLTALTLAAALALSTSAFPAFAATRSPAKRTSATVPDTDPSQPGFGTRLLADLRALVTRPAHMDSHDWNDLALGALAVAATATLDPRVRTWAQDHRNTSSDNFAKSIRPLGSWGAFAILGATWLGGKAAHESSLTATAEDGFEASLIAAGLITPVVKEVIGRERPSYGAGHASFSPFSGRGSFPSGDATLAFSVASVVAAHASRAWLKGAAWGLAGLVGWERIHLDQHWASDVVAGALIGSAVGEWVVHRHESHVTTHVGWVVVPAVAPGSVGLQVARSW
jgi:membrane-associated phospholipid phosphatase